MTIQKAKLNFNNIDDAHGIESLKTALNNIDGVTDIHLHPNEGIGFVYFDDSETSVHALTAAINSVDYVTQLFPEDAPQNPDNL